MKVKVLIVFCIVIISIVSVSFFYLQTTKKTLAKNTIPKGQQNKLSAEDLIVSPQIPKDKVVVDYVNLHKDGFLVVRGIVGSLLSQVVEISKPLKKGFHKNIIINLGQANVSNQDLIVMIYDDYGDDGIFNDFDLPALNDKGMMTASYVKTGKPLPSSITEGDTQTSSMNMPGMKSMVRVNYTDKGFSPDKIEVPVGSMVEFVNESSSDMWVASNPHPQHTDLPTFDQFRPYKKGSIYRYVFDKKGNWGFHDHLHSIYAGLVAVK